MRFLPVLCNISIFKLLFLTKTLKIEEDNYLCVPKSQLFNCVLLKLKKKNVTLKTGETSRSDETVGRDG